MKVAKIIIFLAIFAFQACDDPDCLSETSRQLNISFYTVEENEPDTVFINQLSVIGSDSILMVDSADISEVILTLDPGATSSVFIFDTREYGTDTLEVSYEIKSRLISEDCGVELIFSDLGYLRNDFDSIRILNRILVEGINEDIRIYNN